MQALMGLHGRARRPRRGGKPSQPALRNEECETAALLDNNTAHDQDHSVDEEGDAEDILPDDPVPRKITSEAGPPARADGNTEPPMETDAAGDAGQELSLEDSDSSSSDSSSRSSSSSSGHTSEKSADSGGDSGDSAPAPAPSGRVIRPHTKTMGRAIQFGLCFLTPRFKDKVLSGFQMTCMQPSHNKGRKCTKEVSFGVAGSENICRRMLKSWIVYGASVRTRDDHMIGAWQTIKQLRRDDCLPPEGDLDDNVVTDWEDYNDVKQAQKDCKPQGRAKSKASAKAAASHRAASLLGDALEGVPANIHDQMVLLASQGVIPITSAAQRSRQKGTGGSSYGVPRFLSDTATYGYISPNLPAPAGFVWRCHYTSKEAEIALLSKHNSAITVSTMPCYAGGCKSSHSSH